MRTWTSLAVLLALGWAATRGVVGVGLAAGLALLAGLVAWQIVRDPIVALSAAAFGAATITEPMQVLPAGYVLLVAGIYHATGNQAAVLLLAPLALLLPGEASLLVPPVLGATLVAAATTRLAWLGLPIALLPLITAPGSLAVAIAAACLGVGLLARLVAASPANLAMARRVAGAGVWAMALPALVGVLYTTVVPVRTFWPAASLAGYALVAGLLVGASHIGLAALLATRQTPALWLALAWASPVAVLILSVWTGVTETLGLLFSALAVAAPAAGIGVATLAERWGGRTRGSHPR